MMTAQHPHTSVVVRSVPATHTSPIAARQAPCIQRSLYRFALEDKEASQRTLLALLKLRGVPDEDLHPHMVRLQELRTEIEQLK